MFLRQIADHALSQYAYLIGCQRSGDAIVVDPERDIDRYLRVAEANGLRITAVAETHNHADYLSGARELAERRGMTVYLSAEGGPDWQFEWARGRSNAVFLHGGDEFHVGGIRLRALRTPGHTPEHLSFLVTDEGGGAEHPMAVLSGDFLFVGDVGRPDLLESAAGQQGAMEPSARTLFASLRDTADWPDHLQVLPCHGAGSACGKALGAVPQSVMGYERMQNPALRRALEGDADGFVDLILAGQPAPPAYFARMKRDNRAGPALLPDGRLPVPEAIGGGDLGAWLADRKPAVLDLREDPGTFVAGHLPGALHAPLAGGNLPVAAGSYLPEDAEILLVVENEGQLDEAVRQMVRIGLDGVAGWITAAEALASGAATASIARLAAADLPVGAAVLDVRGADEFEAGHVRDAVSIPHTRLAVRLDEVPEAAPLHVHCASGARAALASAYLASAGRDVVWIDGTFSDIPEALKSS
jgi:hydroxyacylglutathione hydrolase